MNPCTDAQIATAMTDLPDWHLEDGHLARDWTFRSFVEAFGFISRVALLAERQSHHPNLSNCYNQVGIRLITHDVGALTELDFKLARGIDRLLA
ncbi:MAG: 4a-hydroxytetrahydrobiopterin dehydratase [Myxococcota bacterium]